MSSLTRSRWTNIALITLLVLAGGSVSYLAIVRGVNERMIADLEKERLKSERFLSEKLQEKKKTDQVTSELTQLQGQFDLATDNLEIVKSLLSKTERQLLITDQQADEKIIQEQLQLIGILRKQISSDSISLISLQRTIEKKSREIQEQAAQNASVVGKLKRQLEDANSLLLSDIQLAAYTSSGRLTIKASKTRSIKLNFTVAANADSISYTIVGPGATAIVFDENNFNLVTVDNEMDTPVDNAASRSSKQNHKMLEMTFKPTTKLKAGAYWINVFSGDQKMGNFQLTLI